MYRIDKDKCADCGYCNYVCPFQSLIHNIEEKAWEIDREKCKECGQCYDACITKAVLCDDDQKRVETIFIGDNCIVQACVSCGRDFRRHQTKIQHRRKIVHQVRLLSDEM